MPYDVTGCTKRGHFKQNKNISILKIKSDIHKLFYKGYSHFKRSV